MFLFRSYLTFIFIALNVFCLLTKGKSVWLSGQFHRLAIWCLNYLHHTPCSLPPLPTPPAHNCLASVCTSPVMGNSLFCRADGFRQQTLISVEFWGLSVCCAGAASDKGPHTIKLKWPRHHLRVLPKSPAEVFQRIHMQPLWARGMGSVSRVPKMWAATTCSS